MSATDQFPPRHLLPDDAEAVAGQPQQQQQHQQPGDGAAPNDADAGQDSAAQSQQPLALPAPSDDDDGRSRQLDVASGSKVALSELGPMVVNKDGTLSRIHNWPSMTPDERIRTIRVLGARNQIRMADIRDGPSGDGTAS